jgi:hypothetical protein
MTASQRYNARKDAIFDAARHLERITADAQRDANRNGVSMAILNLNPFNPMYVIRSWDDRFVSHRNFVKRVDPVSVTDDILNDWAEC